VIESLCAALGSHDRELFVSDVHEPSYFGLDLAAISEVATIISATSINELLIPALAKWFGSRAKNRRIAIETPLGRVTLETRSPLTEDQIRQRLATLVELL
jgi:hypothetical protein